MTTLTIRQATPGDAPELARLLDLFDSTGATPEQVAVRMLTCQSVLTTFIGELDGQPVGFACLRLIPHLQGDEMYYLPYNYRVGRRSSNKAMRLTPLGRSSHGIWKSR